MILPTVAAAGPTLRAGAALYVSTALGCKADSSLLEGSGILVTLAASALISNARLAPSQHFLYGLSWSTFLPASLAFLLLSLKKEKGSEITQDGQEEHTASTAIRQLAFPFFIALVGTVVGCAAAFVLSKNVPALGMSVPDALIAAPCLAATFSGGSVNFFETAAYIVGDEATTPTVVTSMASADLVVMACYIACLGAILQSSQIKRWFESNEVLLPTNDRSAVTRQEFNDINASPEEIASKIQTDTFSVRDVILRHVPAAAIAISVALTVVTFARRVEGLLAGFIPGLACSVIAAVVPLTRFLPLTNTKLWQHTQNISKPFAKYCFLLVFATIGMSADLSAILRDGPACLVFSLLALLVHMSVAVFFPGFLKRLRFKIFQDVVFEDVLVASNIAIAGPTAAATFCGQLSSPRKGDLAKAATVLGVLGYAIGTAIGVTLYRALSTLV